MAYSEKRNSIMALIIGDGTKEDLLDYLFAWSVKSSAQVDGVDWYTIECFDINQKTWLRSQDPSQVIELKNELGVMTGFDVHRDILLLMYIKWPKKN